MGVDGQPICHCCRDRLWHCLRCWNKHHNGEKHNDYIQPTHFGQSLVSDELRKIMVEKYDIPFNPRIKEDKKRKYVEGDYH